MNRTAQVLVVIQNLVDEIASMPSIPFTNETLTTCLGLKMDKNFNKKKNYSALGCR